LKKYNYISLVHQFYKELKIAKNKGKSIVPILPFFPKYIVQNRFRRDRLEMELPWLTISAVSFLEKHIKSGMKVFEYGAGASTFFFAKKGAQIVSIEHSRRWYEHIKKKIEDASYNNVTLTLEEPVKEYSENGFYSDKDEEYLAHNYQNYAEAILKFEDETFDLIVIDGRVRIACLKMSLPKLKNGGYLVFDNGDRKEYQAELVGLRKDLIKSDYIPTTFDLMFSQTNIYKISR